MSLKQAAIWAKAGDVTKATAAYDKLLQNSPQNVVVLRAVIHFHNRYSLKFRLALPLVARLIKLKPCVASSYILAAETYSNCSRIGLAMTHADQALALTPNDANALFIAAVTYMKRDQYAQAMQFLDHALTLRPDHLPSLIQRGRALRDAGDLAAAADLCRALLAQHPQNINVIDLYVGCVKITADDPIYAHLQNLLPQAQGQTRAHLHKLLGKAQNDMGDYDAAFAQFAQAKALTKLPYDPRAYADCIAKQCAGISRADYLGKGIADDRPVLIVGMPRSGSTLLEQILSGHPDIASAGESPALHMLVQDTRANRHNGRDMVRLIKDIPADATRKIAQKYLAEVGAGGLRILDKSLHNFELLGFFGTLLPNARIIHIHRDPLDTCTSIYMQQLSAWHRYAQDLRTLGAAYLQYRKLMDHWADVLPNPILHVAYEDLIDDTEAQARRIIAFLGLEWTPACLDFQNSTNRTSTLSAWQVRQPIHRASIGRWKHYEKHLGSLKEALF